MGDVSSEKLIKYILSIPAEDRSNEFKRLGSGIRISKVSRLLRKWVNQGLLVKIETGSKKTVKYRLPVDKKQEDLFAKATANKI